MTPGVPRLSHLTHLPTPRAPNSQDAFMAAGGLRMWGAEQFTEMDGKMIMENDDLMENGW